MAFIDIFNFKKYFAAPSDSQVARYGHVNAVYDDLAPRIKNHVNYISTTSVGDIEIPITSYAGTISIFNRTLSAGTGNDDPGMFSFILTGDFITEDSMIILTSSCAAVDNVSVQYIISGNVAEISFLNYSTIAVTALKANFLIIN